MLCGKFLDITDEYAEKGVFIGKIREIYGKICDIILFRIISSKILDNHPK
jgi:hypothetical protein